MPNPDPKKLQQLNQKLFKSSQAGLKAVKQAQQAAKKAGQADAEFEKSLKSQK